MKGFRWEAQIGDGRGDQFMSARGRLFMVRAGRLRGAGGGALHARDYQSEGDQELQHSFPKTSTAFTLLISSFTGFWGLRRGRIVYARLQMTPTLDPMEARFERTLTVTGPVTLDVSANSGVIRVLRGEPGVVRIRGVARTRSTFFIWGQLSGRLRRIAADPPIAQDGNVIGVGDAKDRWLLRGINLLVEIITPEDTEVRALADSGDIRIEGINGPVECETDSGQIEVANINGEVRASSDSGAIHIEGVKGAVDARADSGRIEAFEIAGTIDATTDSGAVLVSQTIVAPVCAKTDSGRIRVKLAAAGGYTVRTRTDNGRIELPQLTRQRLSRREMEGDIRGGGSVVDLETDSGDIEVIAE